MPKRKKDEGRMELLLWRHAEAEEGSATLPDGKRRLTPRGEKQAQVVGRWLRTRLPKDARIVVSPAERAQMTAHALGMPFETGPGIDTDAAAADLLAAAGWPDGDEYGSTVVLVGHQPTLGRLAALLLSGEEADWTIKKGAVWWFSSRVDDGGTQTALRAVIGPDLL